MNVQSIQHLKLVNLVEIPASGIINLDIPMHRDIGLQMLNLQGNYKAPPTTKPPKKVASKKTMSFTDWFNFMTCTYPTDVDDEIKEIEMVQFKKHHDEDWGG